MNGDGENVVALDTRGLVLCRAGWTALGEVRGHLTAYVSVCGGLMIFNLLTSPEYLWVVWPVLGWGVGVASHMARVWSELV